MTKIFRDTDKTESYSTDFIYRLETYGPLHSALSEIRTDLGN